MDGDGVRDHAWHDGVHRKYWDEIVRMLARRLGGRHRDAEDLAQLTFTTAWVRRDVVPDDPRPWLYVTARNHLLNHLRKYRRVEEPLAVEPAGGDGGIAGSELFHDLYAAMRRLSHAEREVLQLGYLAQLTIGEIAQVTNMSQGAVKQRLHRARRKLRDVLQAMNGHLGPGPTRRERGPDATEGRHDTDA